MTCLQPRLDRAVRMAAAFLQEHQVCHLPVEPEAIIRQCGWTLKKYTRVVERSPHLNSLDELIAELQSPDAATLVADDRVTILYNDAVRVPERVRFSLCHEIGHLILEHFIDFDIDTLTASDKAVLELEANVFASNLLAPPGAMMLLQAPEQEQHRRLFGMSRQSWDMRLHTLPTDTARLSPEVLQQQQSQFRNCLCARPKVLVTRSPVCQQPPKPDPQPVPLHIFPWTPQEWSAYTFSCMWEADLARKKPWKDQPALWADIMSENPMVIDELWETNPPRRKHHGKHRASTSHC